MDRQAGKFFPARFSAESRSADFPAGLAYNFKVRRLGSFVLFTAILSLTADSPWARAGGGLPLDPSLFTNQAALLVGSVTKSLVETVGLATDQRPYEPATPLGIKIGLDLGIEATLVRIPQAFNDALAQAGLSGAAAIPVLPIARIQAHKGVGDRVDIGGSFIAYRGYRILGADLKVAVYNPDEGPTWALRMCYSSATLGMVDTKTYTPQVLISRKMDFADPYLGMGYQYVNGSVNINFPGPMGITIPVSSSATATAFMGFLGVGLMFPPLGFKLTLEGTANSSGANTLGTKISFNF